MTLQRFPNAAIVSSKILGEKLKFPNGRTAANRFMKAAMTERLSTYDPQNPKKHGLPTKEILNIYDKWGRGEYGMIITGNVVVDPTNLEAIGNAIIFEEGDSEERRSLYAQWAKNMKHDGALAIMQLSHAGRQSSIWVNRTPFGASDIELKTDPPGTMYGKPIALTTEQIKTEVVDRFVYAAKYAYECGFDGIQLHGAHGYLLTQFTSPTTNNRTDKYGGSLENRNRVIIEIYEAIRREVPESTGFLVGIKSNSKEFQEKGTTVNDARDLCAAYEKHGFDFVELTGGTAEKHSLWNLLMRSDQSSKTLFSTQGTTQGIGLARPATAEPDLPKKILNGSVPSAVKDAFNPNDIIKQIMASGSQIEQMGRKSVEDAGGDVMDQISDYSDPKMVELFIQATYKLFEDGKKAAMAGKAPKTVVFME
ncbi:hypothetical protein L3Y34_006833 [Caenorhabditis briggsae]|uniref:NADH:flavin oxidoreductase/NADH oxidase N-terminal domain-containing protein n=1 Tax=Caenorhabditis briggsae TaxID=6238 RepID=A0AAE9A0S8_CAEBR|nr:hypothetical protein L3Y34_006833 [Caenorhabditis briggsae]